MARILNRLTTSNQRLDLRTILEVFKHLINRNVLLQNFTHGSNNTYGNRFLVCIDESTTNDAVRTITCEQPGSTLAWIAKETAFDNISRKLNGFLSANCYLMNSRSLLGKTCLRSKQRIYTVSKNYYIRGNCVTKCVNTFYLAIFDDEVFYCNTVNVFSTSIFSLLSKPLIEGAT